MDSITLIMLIQNRKIVIGVIKLIIIMADTTLSVSKEFHDWLKSKGRKGENYEDIIKKMLRPEYAPPRSWKAINLLAIKLFLSNNPAYFAAKLDV